MVTVVRRPQRPCGPAGRLRTELGTFAIAGGAVYDALVGRADAADGRVLLTRDRRAVRTYRLLEVAHQMVD